MKKKLLFPLALILILALTACSSIPGMSKSSDSDGQYYLGDKISNQFFDYTVNSAVRSQEYDGYTPADGKQLVVVEVTIKNTSTYSMPMSIYDFELIWGEGDEDYDYPVALYHDGTETESYEIPINASTTAVMVYEAPEDAKDCSLFFLEIFEDDTTGDPYFTYFTLE